MSSTSCRNGLSDGRSFDHEDLIDIVADLARVDSTVNYFYETAVPRFIQANHTSACEEHDPPRGDATPASSRKSSVRFDLA